MLFIVPSQKSNLFRLALTKLYMDVFRVDLREAREQVESLVEHGYPIQVGELDHAAHFVYQAKQLALVCQLRLTNPAATPQNRP